MFNITSKYFSFFNNKPPASWIAHITRDFLTCYSCWYYSSMMWYVFIAGCKFSYCKFFCHFVVVVTAVVFDNIFTTANHFPKIYWSVLRKITIDLFIFETFMTSICEKKILVEVRIIHAEQISLYNFIVLRKNNRHSWRLNKSSKTFLISILTNRTLDLEIHKQQSSYQTHQT